MRILHLIAGEEFGGVETVLLTLARERRLCPGMRPHFAVCFEGRFSRELRASGTPVDYLGEITLKNPFRVLRARAALDRMLTQEEIDVVICHSAWTQGIFAPVAKGRAIPLVFWAHTYLTGRHWTEWWARRTPPAVVICNSRYTEASVRNVFGGISTQVIYYPVSQVAPPEESDSPPVPVVIVPGDDVLELLFIETMQAGQPIVATTFGAASEFVTPDCGILVPPGESVLLEQAVLELLADDDRRARMSTAGPLRAAAMSDPAAQLDRLNQVLSSTAR